MASDVAAMQNPNGEGPILVPNFPLSFYQVNTGSTEGIETSGAPTVETIVTTTSYGAVDFVNVLISQERDPGEYVFIISDETEVDGNLRRLPTVQLVFYLIPAGYKKSLK